MYYLLKPAWRRPSKIIWWLLELHLYPMSYVFSNGLNGVKARARWAESMVEKSNWGLTRCKPQNSDIRKEILVLFEKRELVLPHFLSYDRIVADSWGQEMRTSSDFCGWSLNIPQDEKLVTHVQVLKEAWTRAGMRERIFRDPLYIVSVTREGTHEG